MIAKNYILLAPNQLTLKKMKKVLYVILALVCVYLVLCLMGPSETRVERKGTINASAANVQAILGDFNTFVKWSPWREKDTAMKITVEGEAGKAGHKYTWEGNKEVGKGTMVIDAINGDSVLQTLDMGYGPAKVYMVTKEENGVTNLTWGFYTKNPFFTRMFGLFMDMDKMLGGDFEKGIVKLKALAEAAPVAATYEVKEVQWEAAEFLGTKSTNLNMEKMAPFFGENFPKLFGDLEKNKITPVSAPGSICFKWDDASLSGDMAAVFRVPAGTKIKGWENYTTPAGKVLQIEYFGDYNKIGDAHMAMGKYLAEKKLTNGWVLEEYVTDPMKEKDTAKWQTNIYYMLK